ncbi:MAG: ATP-binding protein [Methylobacterium sp.]|uniref:AlbA family DNA-binding domain-containing protein n=1 Tax=Methylobacterium sp. TaxID=409 RepID=UPI0025D5F821|nr:ATP-binding protein [Methylobacterium sp.]MBX9934772.1 ATP-binding protein [Methylobacterium sp.]
MLNLRTRDDLERLVQERLNESLTLEYKGSPALNRTNDGRSELVKDVTALANAAGGQIIYGIREREGVPTGIDEGIDRAQITPEWIEQVIGTNSSPRLQSLSITEIGLSSEPNRVAYVINVPQSESFAPHQNSIDHKYYRRFERRSVPMADYEIRDAMLRNQKPVLQVEFKFPSETGHIELNNSEQLFAIRPWVMNHSPEPALYSLFKILIDTAVDVIEYPEDVEKRSDTMNLWGQEYQVYEKRFAVPKDFPLIKGLSANFHRPDFQLRIPRRSFRDDARFMLAYQAVAVPGTITEGFQILLLKDEKLYLTANTMVTKGGVTVMSVADEDGTEVNDASLD